MLNEIINAVGMDKIIKVANSGEKDSDKSINILLDTKGIKEVAIFNYDKKNPLPISQLEQNDKYKSLVNIASYISSNKSIYTPSAPKLSKSSIPYSIMFNIKTIGGKLNGDKILLEKNKPDIKPFLINFIYEYINTFKEENETNKDILQGCIEIYNNNIDKIVNIIYSTNGYNNYQLNIFIDNPLEEYILYKNKYLSNKIFDDKTEHTINGEIFGRVSLFHTLNTKKPLLCHNTINSNEIHLIKKNESSQIFHLKIYMEKKTCESIQNKIGTTSYKMEYDKNGNGYIIDYTNNPYLISDDLQNNIIIYDTLNTKSNEITIKKYSELKAYIFRLLDFKVKSFYGDNDSTGGEFKTFASMYYDKIEKLNNVTVSNFKVTYSHLIKSIFNLYKHKSDTTIYKLINIINFDISMRDYLFNTNIREEFNKMIQSIIDKILNEKEYKIDSNEEFFFMCGQMAKYLKSKTQTTNKTNKLLQEYLMANKTSRLIQILQRDKTRLDYDSNINSRCNKIMFSIMEFYTINKNTLNKIDTLSLNMGLYYGDCVLYVTNKTKKNEEGEIKNEK